MPALVEALIVKVAPALIGLGVVEDGGASLAGLVVRIACGGRMAKLSPEQLLMVGFVLSVTRQRKSL